jgi:ABC-type tungstate transport system permease subunit
MRRAVAALALLLAACARESHSPSFTLAAATTLDGSGLLPMLVTEFKRDTGIEIHPIVLGSRQALDLAAQRQAAVTITK